MKAHVSVVYRLILITVILGLLFIVGFQFMQNSQRSLLNSLSETRYAENDLLFARILELEAKELQVIVDDYTYWDEMVDFVETNDPEWAKNNLDSTLENYKINVIWVTDPDFNQVYVTTNLPSGIAPPIPLPPSQLKKEFETQPILTFTYRTKDGSYMQVKGTKIVPGNDPEHKSPAHGYFFVGRLWGGERLGRIAAMLNARVDLVPAIGGPASEDQSLLYVYNPIVGSDGVPLAYLRGGFSNDFLLGYLQAQQREMPIFLALAFTLLILVFAGIGVWVTMPLSRISRSLSSASISPITSLLNDQSEFGRLARLIRDFFEQQLAMKNQIDQLQRAENALRISEQRYRILSEITSDATFSIKISSEGRAEVEWGQASLARVLGQDISGIAVNRLLKDLVHPGDRAKAAAWMVDLKHGLPIRGEVRVVRLDSTAAWMRCQMMPIQDESSGRVARIYGAVQDITQQHAAEEAYRTLVDHSQQGLLITQNDRLIFVNPALERMAGRFREDLVGMDIDRLLLSLFDQEELSKISGPIADLFSGKIEMFETILRIRHSDQNWRWINILCSQTEHLGLPAIQATCIDITEHVQAEEALKEQTDYSNILFSTISSLVIILSPDGRVTACNPSAQVMLGGMDSSACAGRYIWDLLEIPAESPLSADHFARLIKEQSVLEGVEIQLQQNGKQHWLAWSQQYKKDTQNQILYVVGTAVDISERIFKEQQSKAIAEIAVALRGGFSRRETILTILEKIQSYPEIDSVGVIFPVEGTHEFLIEFVQGGLKEKMEGKRFRRSKSMTASILQSGQPYIARDLRTEAEFAVPELAAYLQSVAGIPLISESTAIGVLMIGSKTEITPDIMTFLLPIADMAAGAIERAERFEQAQRRIQQLSALQSINLAIGVSLDLNITLNILTVQITTQLGVDAVDVLLLDPQTDQLVFAAGNGFRQHPTDKTRLWLGEGAAGRSAKERRAIHLFDPNGIAQHFSPPGLFENEDFVAYDVVPLIVKGMVRGVIETYHRPPYTASQEWPLLLEALALETSIAIDNAELLAKLSQSNQDLQAAFDATLQGLARMLEIYDYETEKHSFRVVDLTVKLAQYMGITGSELNNIRRGAYMHDIGKIGIPREILNKNGKLTSEEWEEVVKHPQYAYEIIEPIPFLRPALDIPYSHHERWNGKGYPRQLAGEQIPLAARIFAVIDIFDALTSHRKYRQELPPEEALEYIQNTAGVELDPKVAQEFLELYPLLMRDPFEPPAQ